MNKKIRSKQREYNPKEYFNSWYQSFEEFSDRITISPNSLPIETQYHYNLVENNIIEVLYKVNVPENPVILDIGSGFGHWVDFYFQILTPKMAYCNDIAPSCYNKLKEKYANNSRVKTTADDVSSKDFAIPEKADIINAIGVMFHIVNDQLWEDALANLSNSLSDDGLMIIGGEFGENTENVQFHKVDSYKSWEEKSEAWHKFENKEDEEVLFNKRLRSYDLWKSTAAKYGLEIVDHKIGNPNKIVRTPQNSILALKKKS